MRKKGFTLIELLIVIAVLAILTTVVVVVLNPAQMLAEARDSQRMSDLNSLRTAISLYLASAASPTLTAGPRTEVDTSCGFAAGCPVAAATNIYLIDGTGWVAVDFRNTIGGSPLALLPRDPAGNVNYHYAYKGDDTNKTFELNGRLESAKFRGKMATDGGDDNTCVTYVEATCWYEVGSEPGLDL